MRRFDLLDEFTSIYVPGGIWPAHSTARPALGSQARSAHQTSPDPAPKSRPYLLAVVRRLGRVSIASLGWGLRLTILGFLALITGLASVKAEGCTSIALVLSVDSSSSVDDWEFELEKRGLAQALRNADVQATILSSGPIKLAALFWADPASGIWTSGWHLVSTPADAERVAFQIETALRTVAGNTGLGSGLAAALSLLSEPIACAQRKIINITGDGRETLIPQQGSRNGLSVAAAKRMAEQMGVTVNGLVITSDEPDLAGYYRRHVISGPASFVMEVARVEDYAPAIKRKIMRETEAFVALLNSSPSEGLGGSPAAGRCHNSSPDPALSCLSR